ncbi:uncharacterized protein LOC132264611 [Phlebotomus argentipes]|uniref:uncharacterized protein LOC132264611 n=1 Tax=Phlebotomus argentipes TaxID=94469 RepID=UPI002893649F|nr:uncharacterized protein LOC132264611 [Phlebotomus argentipes]
MKSEVLLSLVIVFVAFQPFPGARCQNDVPERRALSDDPEEVNRFQRQAKAFSSVYRYDDEPRERARRHSPPKPEQPYPHPETLPHQDFPQPQKIVERVRRFAKGTGSLPQRKG